MKKIALVINAVLCVFCIFIYSNAYSQAPTITSQPSNTMVCEGNSTSFTVSATGTITAYQWQVSTDNGVTFNPITTAGTNPTYSGWTTATLTLSGINASNNGYQYQCLVFGDGVPTVEMLTTTGEGNWICPAYVTEAFVECWGAGGAGGGAYTYTINDWAFGGGGGGGAYANKVVTTIPGNSYPYYVPPGGNNSDGENASFNTSTVVAAGGKRGESASNNNYGSGGQGGLAGNSIGSVKYSGGNGRDAYIYSTNRHSGFGGNGAGSTGSGNTGFVGGIYEYGGAGGLPISTPMNTGISQAGYNGSLYGGGGGGAGKNLITGSQRLGGIGGQGLIRITYTIPSNTLSGSATLTVNTVPAAAGTITGSTTVCQGETSVTYTVPSITNATSYIWSLPSGATGTSTTNSIDVDFGTTAISGDITVKGTNSCGDGATSTLAISVDPLPVAAGTITGNATVCQGETSVTYTVPTIANATSYIWTLPSGATGTSTTNIITVDYGVSAVSGNITVKGTNSCGDGVTSALAITVTPLVSAAGTITGSTTVCQGETSVTYNVPSITNATSYIWTLPSGATGTSTTNSIDVDFGTTAISGDISVKGTNSCGDGSASTLAISVVPAPPANAGNDTIICPGSSISLNATGGNSYSWSNGVNQGVPFYPVSSELYYVTVSNGFCTSVDSILVTISTPPAAPVIYQVGSDLHSTAPTGNQWYNDNGLILGATSQIYTPTLTNHYFVILTDTLGCISDTSNILYVVVTGITEALDGNYIKIYPNPVSNELVIEIDGNNKKFNFEILNTIGQVVLKGNLVEKTTVQTGNFSPGVYLIKLENGKTFEFKKIIKE